MTLLSVFAAILSWFGISAKKHRSAQCFQPKRTSEQWRQETFVPEDLITPGTFTICSVCAASLTLINTICRITA